jgi:hypothetical protein
MFVKPDVLQKFDELVCFLKKYFYNWKNIFILSAHLYIDMQVSL